MGGHFSILAKYDTLNCFKLPFQPSFNAVLSDFLLNDISNSLSATFPLYAESAARSRHAGTERL